MKKLVLILFLVISLIYLHAQEYIPIPADNSSHWKIDGQYVLDETCYRDYWNWFYLSGTVNKFNKTYHKLYSKGHWEDHPIGPYGTCSGSGQTMNVYEGAICTVNDTIYYTNSNLEEIIFTYNLNVGDTVPDDFLLIYGMYQLTIAISSVDSVLLETGEYRRRWNLYIISPWEEELGGFIEGIGTEYGIFHPMYISEHNTWFRCYSENYEPIYPPDTWCDPTVDIVETEDGNREQIIYPNPFTTSTTIEYQLVQPAEVTVTIFNHLGKQVEMIQQFQSSGKQSLHWQPQGLPPGMYYFTLQAGDKASSGKVIYLGN